MGTAEGAWVMLAALVTGCCAPQPGGSEPPPPVTGAPEVPPEVPEEFVAIDGEEARRRLWPEPMPRAYVAADAATQQALAGLVRAMLATPSPAPSALAEAARAAGFLVEGWTIAGRRYLVARELEDRRGGGGAYVVRVDARSPVILEAPHGFFDLGTERIALELFLAAEGADGWPRALFVNTVHRYLGADGVKRKQADNPADPCHSAGHLLAVATAAAIEVVPGIEVVQLHGFGDDEAAEGMPAAIVSGGLAQAATPRSRAIAARLRGGLGVEVALFPVDTDRLGATTNVQGRAIHAREGASFVHVEMSAGLRQRLRSDAAARAALASALRGDATDRP